MLMTGRPRKDVLAKIAAGTFRPSRDGDALCAQLGVATLTEAYARLGYGTKRPDMAATNRSTPDFAASFRALAAAADAIADALERDELPT